MVLSFATRFYSIQSWMVTQTLDSTNRNLHDDECVAGGFAGQTASLPHLQVASPSSCYLHSPSGWFDAIKEKIPLKGGKENRDLL